MAKKLSHMMGHIIDIKDRCACNIKNFNRLKREQLIVSSSSNFSPFNLVRELHIDNKKMYENAHTRVLGAILNYNNEFLHSFLKRCCNKINIQKTNVEIEVERQYEKEANGKWKKKENNRKPENSTLCRPDCLVWKKDHIAVIIENKINGACETKHQVENYIKAIYEDPNIFSPQSLENYKKIWVIYIGGDTAEMPSKNSLNKADKLFLIKDNNGENREPGKHLCLVSYKDVIIPWLEEDVLPMCPFGMTGLTGGIMVYIDYLKHRFEDNSSEEEKFYNSSASIQLFEEVNNMIKPFFYEKYIAVSNYLAEIRDNEKEDKFHSFFKALRYYYLNHHFCFKEAELNEKWMIRTTGAFVHVWKKSWERIQDKPHSTCDLYFELYPYQIDTYMHNPDDFINSKRAVTCCLNYKGKDDKLKTLLNQAMKSQGLEEIGEFVFNKGLQRNGKKLNLNSDGAFFDSFVVDDTITQMCTVIDKFLKNY